MFKALLLVLSFTLSFKTIADEQLFNPDNWQVWRQTELVTVSYQQAKSQNALAITAQVTAFQHTPETILSWISEPQKIKNWMVLIKEIKTVDHHGVTKITTLFNFDSVWPLSKRQMILTSEFEFTPNGFEINSKDAQALYPELLTETIVSVPYSHWQVINDSKQGAVTIVYTSITRLNGDIPNMLTDKVMLRSMWQSFDNLAHLLNSSQ
ncbi:hypothetical protein N7931_10625 [Catenovulum sp. 2E275]|uniref:hypothetical protein n=1 Tax=Catenovulum sp. 2E275 TaxID=2980497 RepID=UPI0021D26393|nr:hypothetical protein [Catenovulum sp. 2E275]MCU4676088.1 hypothetical protein [Catenovulum sp. 2E275]